jgi:hypothetical protein
VSIPARLCGASTIPISETHSVEWLRGKIVLEFAIDPGDLDGRLKLSDAWDLGWTVAQAEDGPL